MKNIVLDLMEWKRIGILVVKLQTMGLGCITRLLVGGLRVMLWNQNTLAISTYAFVANNPITSIDPDGRSIQITNVKMTLGENGKVTKITFDIVISMTIVVVFNK